MSAAEAWWPLGERGGEFRAYLAKRSAAVTQKALEAVAAEVPELVGPDPRLRELFASVIAANLDNLGAAVAYKVPTETPFEPPAAVEHARLLAQRGIPASSMLRGYQVIQRSLTGLVIGAVESLVENRDELVLTLEAVMAYLFAQGDGASQAAMRTHVAAREVWLRGRGAGLSKRLDSVLDGTVTDVNVAQRTLDYAVPGNPVAAIAWADYPARPLDAAEAQRRVAAMPGVRDSLLVPRDERTLYFWLHVAGEERIAEWMSMLGDLEKARIAFGERAAGIEGFRLSHMQARSAGAVVAASQKRASNTVVRYRDVAALSFLVERPTESRAWADAVLGALAGPGEDREARRDTLPVFLEAGAGAFETGKRLCRPGNAGAYRVKRVLAAPGGARRGPDGGRSGAQVHRPRRPRRLTRPCYPSRASTPATTGSAASRPASMISWILPKSQAENSRTSGWTRNSAA